MGDLTPSEQIVLGFDTSGPWCSAAIYRGAADGDDPYLGPSVTAALYEDMRAGQAERLLVMIDEVLAEAKITYQDLTRIGVGIGPGNFTGIRISVAAARGLALSLGIPSIGVNSFEALAFGADLPVLTCLEAPRGEFYLQERHATEVFEPIQAALTDIPAPRDAACICIGQNSAEVAQQLGLINAPSAFAPASAIARVAAILPTSREYARPQPYYLRMPDAAPSREKGPLILG